MLMKIRPLHREAWQRVLFNSSILPLDPQVDFECWGEVGKEGKKKREGGLFLILSSPHTLFSSRTELQET